MKFAQQNWKKITLFAAPVLVAGSVYAFAADGGSSTAQSQNATTGTSQSGVTATISAAKPLTSAEMAEISSAKPAPAPNQPDGSVPPSVLNANNPFSVAAAAPANGTVAAGAQTGAATQPAASANSSFDLAQVKNMELSSHTTQGELKVSFTSDGGNLRLDGMIGNRKISVQGDQARELLGTLFGALNLQDALTASLQGKAVKLDASVLGALEGLKIEMNDGRKIESNGHGKGQQQQQPQPQPQQQSNQGNQNNVQQDNGQHNGWQKQEDKKAQKSKGNHGDNGDHGDNGGHGGHND